MKKELVLIITVMFLMTAGFSQTSLIEYDNTGDGNVSTYNLAGGIDQKQAVVNVNSSCAAGQDGSGDGYIEGSDGNKGIWKFKVKFDGAGGSISQLTFTLTRESNAYNTFRVVIDGTLINTAQDFGTAGSTHTFSIVPPIDYLDGDQAIVKITGKDFAGGAGACGTITDHRATITSMHVSGSSTLPVELVSFNVESNSTDAMLTWETATEINNEYFEIQQSTDGQNFHVIGMEKGMGTTSISQLYEFTAPVITGSNNYFRLKQVDYDGKFEYSPVVVLNSKNEKSDVSVYVQSESRLSVSGFSEAEYIIRDVSGRLLLTGTIQDQGIVDISSLNDGLFFIGFNTGSEMQAVKFVK